jgi:alkylated DNA repair dioxygenase AlkB
MDHPDVLSRLRRATWWRPLFRLPLSPRSAYVLGGSTRAEWQHSIPPVDSLRYSISFRTLAVNAPATPRGE